MVTIEINSSLERVLDNLNTPIVFIKEDCTIAYYNIFFTKTFCDKRTDWLGENFFQFFPSIDEQNKLIKSLRTLERNYSVNSNPVEFIADVKLSDNTVSKNKLSISLIPSGEQNYYSVELIKISNNTAIDETELEFYKGIIDKIPLDVAICDPHGKYLYVNPKAVKDPTLRSFLIGKTDFEYFEALGRDMSIPKVRKAKFELAKKLNGLVAWYDEIKDAQGKVHHILRNWYPVCDDKGKLKFMIGFGTDLTDQEVLRKDLLVQTELVKKYKKATEEGTILSITDAKGKFTYVNQNFCDISGYTEDELKGEHYSTLFQSGEDTHKLLLNIENQLSEGKIYRGEMELTAKSGNPFWIHATVIPALNDKNIPQEFLMVSIDIKDQKSAQKVLSRSNKLLEEKVSERTKALETINMELKSFNQMVSHDLQAPLRRLSSFANILMKKASDSLAASEKELLDFIEKDTKYMSAMCSGLLSLAKLGNVELQKTELNMNEIVHGCTKQIKTNTSTKVHFIIHNLIGNLGDKVLITQVWQNLIQNAVKYSSKKDNPQIEISCHEINGKPTYCVKDNGCGFKSEYKEKIFGTFCRLHTQSEFEGTGIGLSTVKKIIEKHGGAIWAEAEQEQGAEFYFTLN